MNKPAKIDPETGQKLNQDGTPRVTNAWARAEAAQRRTKRAYKEPLKRKAVALLSTGRMSQAQVAKELNVSPNTITKWRRQELPRIQATLEKRTEEDHLNIVRETQELYRSAKSRYQAKAEEGKTRDATAFLGHTIELLRFGAECEGLIGAKAAPPATTQILQLFANPKLPGVPLRELSPPGAGSAEIIDAEPVDDEG